MKTVRLDNIEIGNACPLLLIAGCCVIENEKQVFHTASYLKKVSRELGLPFIFKCSFDKANRTSLRSYRGPGIEDGLKLLKEIKKKLDLPLLIDVHCTDEIEKTAEVADILQIPAFLSRQTDLIVEAAKTGKIINIKKGQFLAPDDVLHIIEKIESAGNRKILLTERGTSFGYHNLIVDMRGIEIMKKSGYPVIFDATHSAQLPGGAGGKTSGRKEFIPAL
ncbi:MAG TPA: 3-deoxy-8-phosphooctulonate synthase, partial [bacterium]|nr:3-deoxy-8-phosphooctulonate synthase [bacterium]